MVGQRNALGVSRVHHAKNKLDDCAVELQTSTQQVLIQKAHVSTSLGSDKFLTKSNIIEDQKLEMGCSL